MKVEFRFNGKEQCTIIPENAKDKQLLQLCFGNSKFSYIVPNKDPDFITLEPSLTMDIKEPQ